MSAITITPALETEESPVLPGSGSCPEELWVEVVKGHEQFFADKFIVSCRKDSGHSDEHYGETLLSGVKFKLSWANTGDPGIKHAKAEVYPVSEG